MKHTFFLSEATIFLNACTVTKPALSPIRIQSAFLAKSTVVNFKFPVARFTIRGSSLQNSKKICNILLLQFESHLDKPMMRYLLGYIARLPVRFVLPTEIEINLRVGKR